MHRHPKQVDRILGRSSTHYGDLTKAAALMEMLNRWRILCPSCFDAEAERAGVQYRFVDLEGDRTPPRNPHKRRR